MKAVIYARFSSDKQNEASIEGQLRECLEYAKYNGIDVIGEYIDRAISAKTDNRPDFQRMIKDSYKNAFDTVLVWKLDRFARNRYDSAYYKNILKKNGVRVVSAKESISQGADGILLESILEGYAEYYSAELSEKVRRGMTENALKVKTNGVRAPFGYYVDENDQYQIDVNKEPIVKEVFTRFADGERLTDIMRTLERRGVENRGYTMNYNALYRMLTNRKYIGEYKFGDILIPHGIPAIIDEDLFERVQERLKQNKQAPAAGRGEEEYILTTRLFCGKCGSMMTGEMGVSRGVKQYRYYKCYHTRKKTCDKKSIRKELIENLVIEKILELLKDDDVMEDLSQRVFEIQKEKTPASVTVQAQILEVDRKLKNLIAAMEQGIFSQTTKKALEDLEEQKKNLEIEKFREEIRNPVFTQDEIRCVIFNYRKIDATKLEGRKKLVDSFVNSIYLYDDYFVITFNYKNHSKKVSFDEIKNSCLTSLGSPAKSTGIAPVLFCCVLPSGEPIGFGKMRASIRETFFFERSESPRTGHQQIPKSNIVRFRDFAFWCPYGNGEEHVGSCEEKTLFSTTLSATCIKTSTRLTAKCRNNKNFERPNSGVFSFMAKIGETNKIN